MYLWKLFYSSSFSEIEGIRCIKRSKFSRRNSNSNEQNWNVRERTKQFEERQTGTCV